MEKLEGVYLGIAPIGWTNDDMPDLGKENSFEQTIEEMKLAGFTGCEIGSKFPKDKNVLKGYLDSMGMQICNAWFSSFLLTKSKQEVLEEFAEHLDKLQFLGAKVVGVSEQGNSIQGKLDAPILPNNPKYTENEWGKVCDGFNEMGRLAQSYGITMTVHHHMGTGVQTKEEIDYLMDNTDPSLVYLLLDTGHLEFCGEDYIEILKKYIDRIKHIHLKDIRLNVLQEVKSQNMSFLDGVRQGVFTVPGDGSIDFRPVFETIRDSGYKGWVVVEAEQDPAKANPLLYAKKAREYIREISGL